MKAKSYKTMTIAQANLVIESGCYRYEFVKLSGNVSLFNEKAEEYAFITSKGNIVKLKELIF